MWPHVGLIVATQEPPRRTSSSGPAAVGRRPWPGTWACGPGRACARWGTRPAWSSAPRSTWTRRCRAPSAQPCCQTPRHARLIAAAGGSWAPGRSPENVYLRWKPRMTGRVTVNNCTNLRQKNATKNLHIFFTSDIKFVPWTRKTDNDFWPKNIFPFTTSEKSGNWKSCYNINFFSPGLCNISGNV